jgi:hypothetical protein
MPLTIVSDTDATLTDTHADTGANTNTDIDTERAEPSAQHFTLHLHYSILTTALYYILSAKINKIQ